MSAETGETSLTEENIYKISSFVSINEVSNSKSVQKIIGLNKYQCLTPDLPPLIPRNKRLLNKENDDNPETIDN